MNLMKKTKINKDDKIKFDKLMNQFHEIFNRCQMISKDSIQKERTITLKEPILPVLSTENQRIEENFSENQPVLKQLDFDSYNVERSIMEERNEEIKYLENELKGLNEIFVDVATMIKEQGEQIMTIEQNTEIAANSVEEGVSQLKHASEYQKKSRTKMCCILICILILIAIILLIILMTLKIIPVP
jgi:t-SNARE complex subunit (syntaxin)